MPGRFILLAVAVSLLGACGPPPSPKKVKEAEMQAARAAARRSRSLGTNSIRHTWKKSGAPVDAGDVDDGDGDGDDGEGEGE